MESHGTLKIDQKSWESHGTFLAMPNIYGHYFSYGIFTERKCAGSFIYTGIILNQSNACTHMKCGCKHEICHCQQLFFNIANTRSHQDIILVNTTKEKADEQLVLPPSDSMSSSWQAKQTWSQHWAHYADIFWFTLTYICKVIWPFRTSYFHNLAVVTR